MRVAAILLLVGLPALAQYTAVRDGDIVRLKDAAARTVVSIMPSHGNMAFQMTVNGKNVLRYPFHSVADFRNSCGMNGGVPFLAPWANRLDGPAFYANGKKYTFNLDLGNVRPGPDNHPIHGFLTNASEWEVVETKADAHSARVTSRLDFYRHPEWMAQFPFAHTIEMTYRLREGALEVVTTLHNLSVEPMPVAIGFHPFFQVNDAPRDAWTFGIAARTHWLLDATKIPTGRTIPVGQASSPVQLKGLSLDDVFTGLVRNASGDAVMWVQGKKERVEVSFGRNYRCVVVWSPGGPGRDFICFEPMAAITDALNLSQRGVYKELQSVAPGGTWTAAFRVKVIGF